MCLLASSQLTLTNNGKKNTHTTTQLTAQLTDAIQNIQIQDSEEIDSPTVKKEKLEAVAHAAKKLEIALQEFPTIEQQKLLKNMQNLIDPAKQNIKNLMMEIMQTEWQQNGVPIVQFASSVAYAAITTSLISFAMQAAQIGTGNLLALDTQALVIAGLDAVAANIISAFSQHQLTNTMSPSTLSNIVTQAIITPSVKAQRYTIAMPSTIPSFKYWMISEGIGLASRFAQENSNAIEKIVKNIHVQDILFGKEQGTDIVSFKNASEFIHEIASNKNIQQALAVVGGTVFQAAIIGGLLYLSGFGYAESSMIQSMGRAILTAVAQGTVAQLANARHSTTPGAMISIAAAPLGQQLFTIAGGTPQAAASAIVQAATTEISNVILQDSSNINGLWNLIKKGGADIKQTIQSGWSNTWSALSEGWSTLQEVEAVPL